MYEIGLASKLKNVKLHVMDGSKLAELPPDVAKYLDAIANPVRKRDCIELVTIIQDVSDHSPVMWGNSIIGFGRYHYRYASGHEGDTCLVGLAARKGSISVYLAPGILDDEARLKKLGKVKAGKGCLYITDLDQVDLTMLRELILYSIDVIRQRFGMDNP